MQGVMKLTVLKNGEYVLVCKPDGKHYEGFFRDENQFSSLGFLAAKGLLDGHNPQPNARYSCRPYFHKVSYTAISA